MSCPNCGAASEHVVYLDDRYVVPPQVPTGRPGYYQAAERWIVDRCVGLTLPALATEADDYVHPPCGWFSWAHERSPLPPVLPGLISLAERWTRDDALARTEHSPDRSGTGTVSPP